MFHKFRVCFWLVILALIYGRSAAALPAPSQNIPAVAPIRIAFGSCIKDPDTGTWNAIDKKNPNLILLLGDTIYQGGKEFGNPTAIKALYQRVYGVPALANLLTKFPIAAVWDDHDFGPNNTDNSFSGGSASRTIFREFWRSPPPPPELPDSIAHTINLGRILVIMTDNRTYRVNPSGDNPGAMWGTAQLTWIINTIKSSTAELIVLASGSQVLATHGDHESLRQFPAEQQRLNEAILASKIPVLFVSGDRHYGEILKADIGSKTFYEITSSPLAAPRRTWFEVPSEPRRIDYYNSSNNFGFLTLHPSGELNAQVFNDSGEEKLAVTIKVR